MPWRVDTLPPTGTPASRLGPTLAPQRLEREAARAAIGHAPLRLRGRRLPGPPPARIVEWVFRLPLLRQIARRNFLALRVETIDHHLPTWPRDLSGLRVLQLSDLHIDLDPALGPRVAEVIRPLAYDLAVVTGDYRNAHDGPLPPVCRAMETVTAALRPPTFAILGNHDPLGLVAPLEAQGLRFLLNEHVVLRDGPRAFVLGGIDDPYFFRTHDFAAAFGGAPAGLPRLLLLHAPRDLDAAAATGAVLALCGHTHGGQIRAPFLGPIFTSGIREPHLVAGPWRHGSLTGYTSRGTGGSVAPARFYCPPEVTLHRLLSAD